jgi:hypothetical protein
MGGTSCTRGDGVERSYPLQPVRLGAGGWKNLVTLKGSGCGPTADAEAPGSREARECFCRYLLINQLYLSSFDPLVRAKYFPYFPIFPAAAAKSSGW